MLSKLLLRNRKAMTLMEILLTISLISVISFALYSSLRNGIAVWERSRRLVVEEDIAIFFDKISYDLRRSLFFSKIDFAGDSNSFAFPALVHTQADPLSGMHPDEYIDQIGKIEYYYNSLHQSIYRKQANYSQALKNRYQKERLIVPFVEKLTFNYFYETDNGEIKSHKVLTNLPTGVEIIVEFTDSKGPRKMRKFVDLMVGV